MTFKEKAWKACFEIINEKIAYIKSELSELTLSAGNETKSTAGDKHETALAMLQIEQENKSMQLKELLHQKLTLEKIDVNIKSSVAVIGSLVYTSSATLFLSVGLGKIIVDNQPVYALSIDSSLGQKLRLAKINDEVIFNNRHYRITGME